MAVSRTHRAQPEPMPPWGVYILESHHAADFVMEPRRHAFLKVVYVLAGSGRIRIGDRSHTLEVDEAVVVPIEVDNRIEDDPGRPLSLYVLCVAPSVWQRIDPDLPGRLPEGRVGLDDSARRRLREGMRRMLFEQARPAAVTPLRVTAEALRALSELAAAAGRPRTRDLRDVVSDYAHDLERRFFEADDLDAVAESLGMSRRRFTQLFREIAGQTWLERVRDLRLNHARTLLRETDRPVAGVAFECGYADLSSFYRTFKSQTGSSPLQWRRRQKR